MIKRRENDSLSNRKKYLRIDGRRSERRNGSLSTFSSLNFYSLSISDQSMVFLASRDVTA